MMAGASRSFDSKTSESRWCWSRAMAPARTQLKPLPPDSIYEYPRWSPDDRWIAFQQDNLGVGFDKRVLVVTAATGGDPREIARGADLRGLSWLPGGSGVVYSSSAGSTVLYPPMFNLRAVERDGTGDRQLTFGDVSYMEPDVHIVRHGDSEPDPHAIGHLEISGQLGRRRRTRAAAFASHIRPARRRPLR